MAGIGTGDRSLRNMKDDNPTIRYEKMVPTATKYSIIQFGISCFKKSHGVYKATPYCFYIFKSGHGPDVCLSTSSIQFLRENGMSFGTWITDGITFVDEKQEEFLKKRLENVIAAENTSSAEVEREIVLTRPSDISFMANTLNELAKFAENETETVFRFPNCNSYLRKVIHQQVQKSFKGIIHLFR